MSAVLAVRLKRGLVGESKRVVHAVTVPDGVSILGSVTAVCGAVLGAEEYDVVGRTGMVCVQCVARMATRGVAAELS